MAKRRVVLIHGVNIRRNENHLRRIAPAFRKAGFNIVIPTYGYIPAFLIGMFNWLDERIADTMAGFIRPDDILIGHSNGGTLVYLISQRIPVTGAVLLNAALSTELLPEAQFVHVYFNDGDLIAKLSALLPFSVWGAMGGMGYLGEATNVTNIDQGKPPDGLPALDGHSDVFTPGKVCQWAKFMAELVLKALNDLENDHGNSES